MDHLHVNSTLTPWIQQFFKGDGGGGGVEKVNGLGGWGVTRYIKHACMLKKTKHIDKQLFIDFLFFFIGECSIILKQFSEKKNYQI